MIRCKLPELMAERHITPMDLVRKADISQVTAYKYAKGEVGSKVDVEVLNKLCVFFGCQVGDLLVWEPSPLAPLPQGAEYSGERGESGEE